MPTSHIDLKGNLVTVFQEGEESALYGRIEQGDLRIGQPITTGISIPL